MFNPYTSFFVILCLALPVSAQSQKSDSIIDSYIQTGIENNLQLANDSYDGEIRRSELRSARGRFLPHLSFEASYTFSGGGRSVDFPVGDLFNPVHENLNNLTGDQVFPTNLNNVNERFLPDNYHDTKLRVVQPIFNTELYYSYRAQKNLVSQQEARHQVLIDDLTREIKVSYLNYFMATDQLAVFEANRELVTQLIQTAEALVRNGKETGDAVLTAQFELANIDGKIEDARRQQASALAYFNFLLNRDLDAPIRKDSDYLEMIKEYPDINRLQEDAMNTRPEFEQVNQGIFAARNKMKLNRGSALPELFVIGESGLQGVKYRPGSDQGFWFVQLGMRWNLFKGNQNRERIEQAQINLKKLDNQYAEIEQQIKLRVIDSRNAWSAAEKKLDAAKAGLDAAEAGFETIRRRYEENQVLLVEYLKAQDNYISARLQYAIAKYDLKKKETELERESGR